MVTPYTEFAQKLAVDACYGNFQPSQETKITIPRSNGAWSILDLTPFAAQAQACTARSYFTHTANIGQLLQAYEALRQDFVFEENLPGAMAHVSSYAEIFRQKILTQAVQFDR